MELEWKLAIKVNVIIRIYTVFKEAFLLDWSFESSFGSCFKDKAFISAYINLVSMSVQPSLWQMKKAMISSKMDDEYQYGIAWYYLS